MHCAGEAATPERKPAFSRHCSIGTSLAQVRASTNKESGWRVLMTENHGMSRRVSRRTALGVLAGGAVGAVLSGGSPFSPAFAAKTLTVGFIYVGPRDDFGYNQAHAEAAAML